MINTRRAVHQSSVLAAEWGKHGRLLDNTELTRSKKGHFSSKKSDETKANEAAERRYQRRSNTCGTCFELKSMSGTCQCTD